MRGLTVVLTGAALCAAGQLRAAEWSAAPRMAWSVDHNSNRLFIEEGPASQAGSLQLDLLLKRATPTTSYSLQPRASWQRYSDHLYQNTESQSLSAAGSWLFDRQAFSANALWSRDDSLNNEIEDTGAFTGSTRRKMLYGGLSWSAQQTTRSQIQAQVSFSNVKYTYNSFFDFFGIRIPVRNLFAYQYPSVNVTESYQWSDRSSLQLTGYAARLMYDDRPDSDSYGTDIGLTHALTKRITLTLSGGASLQSSNGRDETGYLGRFDLTRRGEREQWRLFARRSVQPSGYGFLTTQDEAGVSYDFRLTPRLNSSFSARALRSEDITLNRDELVRRYDRAEAALTWVATRSWNIRGATSFQRGQRAQDLPMENGWSASLQAVWAPQPDTLSR